MSAVKDLLQGEKNGAISFGDYTLKEKKKKEDFEFDGNIYKVKTFYEITKLEKNGSFAYESVPGSSVHNFLRRENGVSFDVESNQDVQITLELAEETEYVIYIDEKQAGLMQTNHSGKLTISVELEEGKPVHVKVMTR